MRLARRPGPRSSADGRAHRGRRRGVIDIVRRAGVAELKRLRELEAENSKLKRMYADLALENAAIKEVLNRKL